MLKYIIRLIAKRGSVKKCLLKVDYRYKGPQNSRELDIYWFLDLPYWVYEQKGGKKVPKCLYRKAHASYHNSGEVHLIIEDNGAMPQELIQNLDPPLQLNGETMLYQTSLVSLADLGSGNGAAFSKKKSELLVIDTDNLGNTLLRITLSFLPPQSSETETEIVSSKYSTTYIVKRMNPWCKVVVENTLQPVIDQALEACGA